MGYHLFKVPAYLGIEEADAIKSLVDFAQITLGCPGKHKICLFATLVFLTDNLTYVLLMWVFGAEVKCFFWNNFHAGKI